MTAQPIYQGQTFFAPAFRLVLAGRDVQGEAVRDVTEISYSDDLETLDSFEVTLHDWDAVGHQPKYSSPLDETGSPVRLENGDPVPNFEPGAAVELYLGYQDAAELPLMMRGVVVSLTPSFPAQGAPALTVRAVNALVSLLDQKRPGAYQGTVFDIAKAVGRDMDIAVETPPADDEPALERMVFQDQYPIVALLQLARRTGCRLWWDEDAEVLRMERAAETPPEYEIEWGKSLIRFSPTLTTRGQVSRVTVHGVDPTASGEARRISGSASWSDFETQSEGLDDDTLGEVSAAIRGHEEDIHHEPVTTEAEAQARARAYFRAMTQGLITGSGATVGAPALRSGRPFRLAGLGRRFNGLYTATRTTHTLGADGYVTTFSARKEILR